MKKNYLLILLVCYFTASEAQQWLGNSNATDLITRTGNVVIGGSSISGSFGTAKVFQLQGSGSLWLSMASTSSAASFNISLLTGAVGLYSRERPLTFYTSTVGGGIAERMRITMDGNVGIGTTLANNPNSYKLAVNGIIGAKEVLVENTSTTWADYVFQPDYKLLSLSELSAYIVKNKHLPEVPTTEEVRANGHKLGEMDVVLLKKVEELTLYIVELNKRVETLEAENKKLKDAK